MRSVLVATAFLTRLPVRIEATAADVRVATRWFPLVGATLGVTAAVLSLALARANVPALLAATLLTACGAWVTGAMHLDGLADMADGFGGGRSKDDVLRIMRDPRVGSFGAVALIVVIGLKIAALATLIERQVGAGALIVAPTLSRWSVAALGAWLPYARAEGGLGEAATNQDGVSGLVVATSIAIAVSAGAAGTEALALWVSMVTVVVAIGRSTARRIGGITGDVFGASVELSETAVLVVAAAVNSHA
jgi:adenosylcobinamide-GDP ribazoletransferase